MNTIYYATDGNWYDLLNMTNRLSQNDLNGNGNNKGGILSQNMVGHKVNVYQITFSDLTKNVVNGSGLGNSWAPIFNVPGVAIQDEGRAGAIQGSSNGSRHEYTITDDSAAYAAKSLKDMWNGVQG
ncbi:hypothetical protein [Lentilactobacillus sunkii]|uniref:hypothetical protein n=1 Tax=Lentilactobacillus sunkii TaxID=481719 RepID=UPI0007111E3B|nr:hypothetical protein [Lentilactobacillus sunkii]